MAHYAFEPASRGLARTFALTLLALLALFWSIVLFATWGSRHGLFGWNVGSDGTTLIYVAPGGPAARAGLRAGDRIDWATLPLRVRANLAIVEAVPPALRFQVAVERNGVRHIVRIAPAPWPPIFEFASRALNLAGLVLFAVGLALVQLRPSRMTWGFLFSAVLWAYPTYISWLWAQGGPWRFGIAEGAHSLLVGAYAAGIMIFMSRFPADRARGPLAVLDRMAIPLGLAAAALGLFIDGCILFSKQPPPGLSLFVYQSVVQVALFAVALGALLTSYHLTRSGERQRIVPVLVAYALYVSFTIANNLYSAFFTNAIVTAVQYLLIAVSMVALALAVANGVIRHRVFDVSFGMSRTVVYTVLTSLVVGVLALADFLSSQLLERLQIAVLLEACVALALGIWLNALHSRIDRFVDQTLFRRRHAAEARLERAARALVHSESAAFVDEVLVIEPCEALSLASAAVFRRDAGTAFMRVYANGWKTFHMRQLPGNDTLTVTLRAELDAVDLLEMRWDRRDAPEGAAQPIFAVPLVARHELLGAVLFGGHTGGEAIDPDEQRVLVRLAQAAAVAYEHVRSQVLAAEIDALREQNALLETERRVLRETLATLRSVGGGVKS